MSAFIEMDYGSTASHFSDPSKIASLTEGSFIFRKDYPLFDALAGGRQSVLPAEAGHQATAPLFSPRGLPVPQSLAVAQQYFFLVTERSDLPDQHFWPQHRRVTSEVAQTWIKSEKCCEAEVTQWFNSAPGNQSWKVVSAPGVYGASWLLPKEFDAAILHHGIALLSLPVEYAILRNAMALLGSQHEPEGVRLVFWFS